MNPENPYKEISRMPTRNRLIFVLSTLYDQRTSENNTFTRADLYDLYYRTYKKVVGFYMLKDFLQEMTLLNVARKTAANSYEWQPEENWVKSLTAAQEALLYTSRPAKKEQGVNQTTWATCKQKSPKKTAIPIPPQTIVERPAFPPQAPQDLEAAEHSPHNLNYLFPKQTKEAKGR